MRMETRACDGSAVEEAAVRLDGIQKGPVRVEEVDAALLRAGQEHGRMFVHGHGAQDIAFSGCSSSGSSGAGGGGIGIFAPDESVDFPQGRIEADIPELDLAVAGA